MPHHARHTARRSRVLLFASIFCLSPLLFPVRHEPPHPAIQSRHQLLAYHAARGGVDLPRLDQVYRDYAGLRQIGFEHTAARVARQEMRGRADVQAFEMLMSLEHTWRELYLKRSVERLSRLDLPDDEPLHRPFPTREELAGVFNTLLRTGREPEALFFAYRYRLNVRFGQGGRPAEMRIPVGRRTAGGGVEFQTATPYINGRRVKISKSGWWIDRFALYKFEFANGASATGTRDHHMLRFRPDGKLEKVPLRLMRPGDLARDSSNRRVPLVSMFGINPEEPVPVYNITVEGAHTYFVGGTSPENAILVHNAGPEEYGSSGEDLAINTRFKNMGQGPPMTIGGRARGPGIRHGTAPEIAPKKQAPAKPGAKPTGKAGGKDLKLKGQAPGIKPGAKPAKSQPKVKKLKTPNKGEPAKKSAPAKSSSNKKLAKNKTPKIQRNAGETEHTAIGRKAHKNWNPGSGYVKEFQLPSGKKVDAINFQKKAIKELKPNNPRKIREGRKQVDGYVKEAEKVYGGKWTGTVETYKAN